MWDVSQIRDAPPSEYEAALCEALFGILSREIHDLPGIVQALNESTVRPKGGGDWTEDVFKAEMRRLGDGLERGPVPKPRL